jgi:LEA14-like dessication related protein
MKRCFFILAGVLLVFSCKSRQIVPPAPPAVKAKPIIREPEFSIVEMVILQNTLVNTRLKVKLQIDNPNDFPLELTSFQYELSSQGRYWSDGTTNKVCTVPAKSNNTTDVFLVMNFTSQSRDLLEQVIAQSMIAYRFSGDAEIKTVPGETQAIELKTFTTHFDLQGVSEVRQ